ncbi:hypothetical protein CERSUDRAFT_113141 [Gelatoporia subvermispora B]|uniref:Uncharacterized protein n=1 Tax=Ceriporiopsis subvermispora (strain B) TaxID=914234 RepID=M2RHQ9_CERS8|nr:hypothetical protein CERSUDRAFT_113141 [Gelatoporia subvermispora B]
MFPVLGIAARNTDAAAVLAGLALVIPRGTRRSAVHQNMSIILPLHSLLSSFLISDGLNQNGLFSSPESVEEDTAAYVDNAQGPDTSPSTLHPDADTGQDQTGPRAGPNADDRV